MFPKQSLNLTVFPVFLLLVHIFPSIFGTMLFSETLSGFLYLLGVFALGTLITEPLKLSQDMLSISKQSLAVLIGSVITFSILVFTRLLSLEEYNFILLLGVSIISLGALFLRYNIVFSKISREELYFIIAVLCCSFFTSSLARATEIVPSNSLYDYDYFTQVVASIRQGTIFSAAYELDTPLAYQSFFAFPIATYAEATQTPSHVATWGVWAIIYAAMFYIFLGELVRKYTIPLINQLSVVYIAPIGIISYLLLVPINWVYFFKFAWHGILLGGLTHVLPAGNTPFMLAMPLACLTLYYGMASLNNKTTFWTTIFLVSLLAITKLALFFPVASFLGILYSFRFYQTKETKGLLALVIAAIPTVFFFKVFFHGSIMKTELLIFNPYLIDYFVGIYGQKLASFYNKNSTLKTFIGLFILLAVVLYGTLTRTLLFVFLKLQMKLKNFSSLYSINHLLWACIISVVISLFMGFIFDIKGVDAKGVKFLDANIDLLQFGRASFILFSFLTAIFLPIILDYILKTPNWINTVAKISISIWLVVALLGNIVSIYNDYTFEYGRNGECNIWAKQVKKEQELVFDKSKKQLLVGFIDKVYDPNWLVVLDVKPFWYSSTIGRTTIGGLNLCAIHQDRRELTEYCLADSDSIQRKGYEILKANGVTTIIANPTNEGKLKQFAEKFGLKQLNNCKYTWVLP